ncbi:hypothetical protein KP509_39G000600 [Ceratopteris richardii]|uniref:Endoglucanase n=1 Tax=Ceratopteris richardii TaxID=49495 RepID=A0A8T2PXW6_CERRI|nr:hypothetical protein KP509_39G000600 [Ceratopteris richardii]
MATFSSYSSFSASGVGRSRRSMTRSFLCAVAILLVHGSSLAAAGGPGYFNYADALHKNLLYFEAQRSGKLPANQRVQWRGDSAVDDGKTQGVDLQGGYYDAGDHVKFGFPMAYSMTMLAWGIVQYKQALSINGELGHALEALRWGTEYFIKAHPEPNVFWTEVGDGASDHDCWQRAEDMTTSRQAYRLDASSPGSDQAGEAAAALAAASLAFKNINPPYAATLLQHARQLFTFADSYRGKYDDSIPNVKAFYESVSGYNDELLWGAVWLHQATGEQYYLDYVINNADSMGGSGWNIKELSWDVKYAGVQILVSKILLEGNDYMPNADVLRKFQNAAEFYLCSLLRKNNGYDNAQLTSGGLLFTRQWNNMQYVTSAALSLVIYSDYLAARGKQLQCPSGLVPPSEMFSLAKSQVDYILGQNPMGMSYMVGYGSYYPKHVHHRGASIVSYKQDPRFVSCKDGYATWYLSAAADPNLVIGAVVGGPDASDHYYDDRTKYEQSEPTISANSPLVGVLARLAGGTSRQRRHPTAGSYVIVHRPLSLGRGPAPYRNSPTPTKALFRANRRSSRQASRRQSYRRRGNASTLLAFQQVITTSWIQNSMIYHRYAVKVTNLSPVMISNVRLRSDRLTGPVYGMDKVPSSYDHYAFPASLNSLSPRQTVSFVYIQPGPQAVFTLASYSISRRTTT